MQSKLKIILGAITGNIVEYYDFGIYAVFATIIGRLFFPTTSDLHLEIIMAFAVFSIGFMMRPLGGLVFGYIGDKFGRKNALIISICGMSLSTLSIGLLPTYESIGFFAPVILIAIRMIQGLCIGGESTGSAIYIIEHIGDRKVSLMSSLVMTSNIIGTLVANIVAMILDVTIGIDDYTWRYCFIIGFIMGIISLYFRIKNDETPTFKKMNQNKDKSKKAPVKDIIRRKKYAVLSIFAIAACATSITYLIRGYLNAFLIDSLHYTTYSALYYTIFTLSWLTILFPVFGLLTDKFGTNKVLNFGVFFTLFSIIPAWYLVVYTTGIWQYIGLLIIAIMGAAMGSPAYPHAINTFPPQIRYSGVGLGWNLGNAVFGGTTPIICTILCDKFGLIGPAFYLIFTASIFIILRWSVGIYMKKLKYKKS
jgi:MHS family proline/betaine transporter-like MFS transporter